MGVGRLTRIGSMSVTLGNVIIGKVKSMKITPVNTPPLYSIVRIVIPEDSAVVPLCTDLAWHMKTALSSHVDAMPHRTEYETLQFFCPARFRDFFERMKRNKAVCKPIWREALNPLKTSVYHLLCAEVEPIRNKHEVFILLSTSIRTYQGQSGFSLGQLNALASPKHVEPPDA